MKIDLSTVIGVLLAWGMVIMGMILASGGDIGLMLALFVYQPDSAAITIGGSLGAVIISTPLSTVTGLGKVLGNSVFENTANTDHSMLISELTEYATEARRNGVLALDARTDEVDDPFIKGGLQLAVDGTAPEQIEEIMGLDLEAFSKRHERNRNVLMTWAEFAPAYGMIGTLVGLIAMLADLSDPDSIGPAMAIALITTMYGSMAANMFCIPLANKLKTRTEEEVVRKEMVITAILGIQNGDNPRIIRQKLLTFVRPDLREELANQEEEG